MVYNKHAVMNKQIECYHVDSEKMNWDMKVEMIMLVKILFPIVLKRASE